MTVVTVEAPYRWTALRDGVIVGQLRALIRPDERCFLFFRDCASDAHGPLLDTASVALDQDVYIEVNESAGDIQRELIQRGFTVNRREHRYLLPTDPARTGLPEDAVPAGFSLISAAGADVDLLRELDDVLRQDVPGAAGWRNDPGEFPEQTFGDPDFDPATYLLAVNKGTGQYVGLVRVWITPSGPRLGLIGTLRAYRRRGLAVALIAQAFAVLHRRGQPEATCEVDQTNTASNALMTRIGASRIGGNVELVRRHASS